MNYGMDYQGDSGGGGGFNSGTQNNNFGSQGTPSSKPARKAYDEQTLIPLTIKMILSATVSEGNMTLPDGRPLHQVKFVGAVRSVENLSTNAAYQIEDGTGLLEVKQWMDDNDCTAAVEMKEQAAKDHQYVRVIGQVKDYDGRKSLIADSIRKLSQGDELTHHFLEVVHSAEQYSRKDRIGGMLPPPPHHMNTSMSTPIQAAQSGGGDRLKDQVLNYIKVEGEKSDVGAPVDRLCQLLRGQYQEDQVRAAIEDLASEGHIYSTINEDNYKFAM